MLVASVVLYTAALQPGQSGAAINSFESYVLALEWQPSWSLDACPGKPYENAALIAYMNSSASRYAREHLSLHGLWPTYNPMLHAGFEWPQYCKSLTNPALDYSTCAQNMTDAKCRPSMATLSQYNTTTDWQTWAPQYSYGDLATHEWAKHGGCNTNGDILSYAQYYYWGDQKAALVNVSMGHGATLVSRNVGKNISYIDLQAAFDADAGGHHTTVSCVRDCELDQVWLGFALSTFRIRPVVTPSHGVNTLSASSCAGCKSVHIRAWQGCPP